MFFVLFVVCLHPVSSVPDVTGVSGLSIFDYLSVFSNVYLNRDGQTTYLHQQNEQPPPTQTIEHKDGPEHMTFAI